MSSYDLQEKIDHGKEEQVEETCNGKGQASRRQEERREKESPAGEGEGKGEEDREEGREAGRAQEGQAQSQSRGQEGCAQTERAQASSPAGIAGTDSRTALDAGRRHSDIAAAYQYRTVGVLEIRRREH
jgi:hypothetical protein